MLSRSRECQLPDGPVEAPAGRSSRRSLGATTASATSARRRSLPKA